MHANKAVPEGSVAFYLEYFVSARVTRLAYGTSCVIEYNPQDADHIKRRGKAYMRPSGRMVIPNSSRMILAKGSISLRENDEVHSQWFCKEASSAAALKKISTEIVCYRGSVKNPKWTDAEPEKFTTLCTIFADTTQVKKEKQRGGSTYFTLDFRVVLLCGSTEMRAHISWIENGK